MEFNSLEVYRECGEKAAKYRHQRNESSARFHSEWANRAFLFETEPYRTAARKAFSDAYRATMESYAEVAGNRIWY
jgi:hypothetical protein